MSPDSYGRVVQRALLTNELQQLRRGRKETQESVARALEWSVSKLIRLEGGHVGISRSDLLALLSYYEVTNSDQIAELVDRAREARQPSWWDAHQITDKAFSTYVGYEAGASDIRVTHGLLVPGLLQTEAYTRQVLAAYGYSESQIEERIALRAERQLNVLARAPRQYHVIDEAVIRRRVGNVMPSQLRRIIELSEKPEITIQIVPFEAGPHRGMKGPFVILSFEAGLDDILYLENERRGDLVLATTAGESGEDGHSEVAEYRDAFDRMGEMARDPAESVKLIENVISNSTLLRMRFLTAYDADADHRSIFILSLATIGKSHPVFYTDSNNNYDHAGLAIMSSLPSRGCPGT